MILACWVERQEQLDYRSCFAPFWETRAIWKSVLSPSLILERAVTQSHSTALSEAGVCQIHLNVMSVVFLKPNTLQWMQWEGASIWALPMGLDLMTLGFFPALHFVDRSLNSRIGTRRMFEVQYREVERWNLLPFQARFLFDLTEI